MNDTNDTPKIGGKKEKQHVEKSPGCFVCGASISDPGPENYLGDEAICNACREQMLSSLEDAWVKHSAFLDSALN